MVTESPPSLRRSRLRPHALALLALAAVATACASPGPVVVQEAAPSAPAGSAPAAATSAVTPVVTEPCVYVSPPPAPDSPPEGWSQEGQELLMTWSMPVIDELGLGEDGLTLSYAPPTVTVLRPDPLPPSLDPLIADAAAAGVTITWQEVPYDPEELFRLTETLFDALPQSAAEITGVGPAPGATGLRIYTALELDRDGCAEVRRAADEAVPGVPISFQLMPAGDRLELFVEVE